MYSDNEQAAINREYERYQRWIENLDNWRTGPIMAGPSTIANPNGAPIEVVQQLRVAGENIGFASMGMVRNSRPVNGRPLYVPQQSLNYRPINTGTFVRPIRQYNFASLEKLGQHFIKHGGEFKAKNINEYLNIGNYNKVRI